MDLPPPDAHLHRLLVESLTAAGLPPEYREVSELRAGAAGSSNDHYLVTLADGSRAVLRVYQWPLREVVDDLRRPELEAFVHRLVRAHDVPAPALLAGVSVEGRAASLLEYVEGERMADVLQRGDPADADQIWYAVGQALRRLHSIAYPAGTHGRYKGTTLEGRGETAGAVIAAWSRRSAEQLASLRPELAIDLHALDQTLARVVDRLRDAPSTLLHFDVHPWNILVVRRDGRYACAALLDWENASVGDPAWDVMLAEVLTAGPGLGPTSAFYAGYRRVPPEGNRAACELAFMLHRAAAAAARAVVEERRGHAWWVAEAVEAYVCGLPDRLRRLDALL